jgi:hypothetical protein
MRQKGQECRSRIIAVAVAMLHVLCVVICYNMSCYVLQHTCVLWPMLQMAKSPAAGHVQWL